LGSLALCEPQLMSVLCESKSEFDSELTFRLEKVSSPPNSLFLVRMPSCRCQLATLLVLAAF